MSKAHGEPFSDDPEDDRGLRNKFHAAAFDPGELNVHSYEFHHFSSQNDNGGFYTQGKGKKICKYRYIYIWNYAVFSLALDGTQVLKFLD